MHSRNVIVAFHRVNPSLQCLSRKGARRYASQHVTKPLPVEATADNATSIPFPEDDSPPKKKRPRKPKADMTATQSPPKKRASRKQDDKTITPGSTHHTTLTEFLAYATTTSLSQTSTVYRGTHYEYTVAASLTRLSFSLTRVGRTSDLGIDLLGTWAPPSLHHAAAPLNVLVQCKAEAPKPSMIRELEGAVVGAPLRYRGAGGLIAILAAAKDATKGVRDAVGRSTLPMAFLNVTTEGKVRQFVWNHAAVECALEGVGVALRYSADGDSDVALTWKGMPWSPAS